jgi:photosystem II stability/assembly factor-like uncharacterized protein
MKKRSTSQSAYFNLRVLIGLFVALTGAFLALLGFGAFSKAAARANGSDQVLPRSGPPTLVPSQGHQFTPWTPEQAVPLERMPKATGAGILLDTVNWTAIGPAPLMTGGPNGNVSGRITGIAAHPTDANTIYVSPAGGGVWKTTDGGSSWSMLTDPQPTLSMGAIAIAPSNANVLYAGTGEANNSPDSNFGRGILISTDAGATWTLRTGPADVFNSQRLTVSKIDIHPTDPNTAYAAVADRGRNGPCWLQIACGSDTGIFKTTDGGANWINVTSAAGLDMVSPWSDVLIDQTVPTTVYAAHGDPRGKPTNGVYKSTDGGTTWTLLANAPRGDSTGRIAIALSKSNHLVLYVTASNPPQFFETLYTIQRSDDGGATFTDLTPGTPEYMGGTGGGYNTTVIVDPTNSAIVYVGGSAGTNSILRSRDSGVTWTGISYGINGGGSPHADHHAMTFDANGKLLDGDDGGIYRLDSDSSLPYPVWSNLNGNLDTIQFYGIGLHPTDANVAIGGSMDNGTELFRGAVLWVRTESGDGGFSKFSQTNGNIAYHQEKHQGGVGTHFFRVSTNGGLTWVTRTSGIDVDVNVQQALAPFVVDPRNGDRVLYGTNKIWETTNQGITWTRISDVGVNGWNPNGGFVNAIGLAPSDANTIYAATHPGGDGATDVFVTTDHGSTWTQRNLPVVGPVQDIQVDPATPTTAYAVISSFTAGGNVFKTTNAGTTWTNISGNLPSEPVWSLQIDALGGALYVGAEDGVYVTTDGGAKWSRFGAGLPNAQVFQIELNNNLRILGAGTHGRGMWEIRVSPPRIITVTFGTDPAGLSYTLDGTTYNSAQMFSWLAGSSHTISTTSLQSNGHGVRYAWTSWRDGGDISHDIAPTTSTAYTAEFTISQYFLNVQGRPTGCGLVGGSGWKDPGAHVFISASRTGFIGWEGSGNGSYSGPDNPASITMDGPISEIAFWRECR